MADEAIPEQATVTGWPEPESSVAIGIGPQGCRELVPFGEASSHDAPEAPSRDATDCQACKLSRGVRATP